MWKLKTFLSLVAVCLGLVLGAGVTSAQTVGSQARGGDLLASGEGALAKGKYQAAARNFSKAMRAGDLSNIQVAKALYQRGIAYEKTGRPAQAIADITSALYIEGLPGRDRVKAYLSRGRAYEAVGMSDLARADLSRARSGGASERQIARSNQPAPSVPGAPSFSTSVQSPGSRPPAPAFRTQVNRRAPEPKRRQVASFETQTRAPRERIPRFRTTILPQESKARAPRAGATRRTNQRTAQEARPAAAPSNWDTSVAAQGSPPPQPGPEQSEGRVGQFLGGLWERATASRDEEKQTAAAAPAPPQWSQTSTVIRSATPVRPAPRPAIAARSAPSVSASGSGYRIQLAALRSDAEAQATWKRLASKHRKLLAGRQPNIVRTELGGLGTFYRVQLGPFADKGSSQQLCRDFKAGGLDCFLLAP